MPGLTGVKVRKEGRKEGRVGVMLGEPRSRGPGSEGRGGLSVVISDSATEGAGGEGGEAGSTHPAHLARPQQAGGIQEGEDVPHGHLRQLHLQLPWLSPQPGSSLLGRLLCI